MGWLFNASCRALCFFLATSFFSSHLLAEGKSPSKPRAAIDFKQNPTNFTAAAGVPFSVDLVTLLKSTGTGPLSWSASAEKPAWLALDSAKAVLTGTPTALDEGSKSFRLGVQDADSGAFTQVNLTVVLVPKWSQSPLDLGLQNEERPWTLDLKTKVTHPKPGGKLSFTAQNLQGWMTLSQDGVLSGTPKRADVKKYSGITLTATTESGGKADVAAFGEVLKTVKPPRWTTNPLPLADAPEDSLLNIDLTSKVINAESQSLSFEIIGTKPAWVRLSPTGVLSGIPRKADVGAVKFTARVTGPSGSDNTLVQFAVSAINHAPEWLSDPVVLPEAWHGIPYSQDLKNSVRDQDGDKLTFELVEGPTWAKLSPEGVFSGTATKKDIGNQSWIISVTDGSFSPKATLKILVKKSNEPPYWLKDPTELPNANEDQDYSQSLLPFVRDPDGDAIRFKVVTAPAWIALSEKGDLSGKPGAGDIGPVKIRVKISDGIAGTSEAEVAFFVNDVNHPPKWLLSPIQLTAKEGQEFTFAIAQHATDRDVGDTLTFKLLSGPAWITFNATGTLSGKASKKEVGTHRLAVRADDSKGGTADTEVIVSVTAVNHPPLWSEDPIKLDPGKEGAPYEQALGRFASDPDGDTLTFEKAAGPNWLSVEATTGKISGTPKPGDAGLVAAKIRIKDGAGLSAVTTAQFLIERLNTAPKWSKDPLAFGSTLQDEIFLFNTAPFATDPQGDPLAFSKVSGPDWLFINPQGQVSGKPAKKDIGPFVARFKVSDGEFSAEVDAKGEVLSKNNPPQISAGAFQYALKERDISTRDLKPFVTDPDGDPIKFSVVAPGGWVTLSQTGELVMSPKFAQLGDHTFTIRATDGTLISEEPLRIKVLRNPRAPEWQENPIKLSAQKNQALSASLLGKAKDLDGLTVSYAKVSGPAWINVHSDGTLSGTAKAVGSETVVVSAKNDLVSANADVVITVSTDNKAPFWTKNPVALADAREGRAYAETVLDFVKDPNAGDTLSFSKISGPNWAFVSTSGTILGTPALGDLGQTKLAVRVTDSEGLFAEAEVDIIVKTGNLPPRWNKDPLLLGEVAHSQPFSYDLTVFAEDPDEDRLEFKKISGPTWLSVSPAGQVSGTPALTDMGGFTAVFEVTDRRATAQVGALGKVITSANKPPVLKAGIAFSVKAGVALNTSLNQPQYASDPDGDPLQFTLLNAAEWIELSANGTLKASPQLAHLGESTFRLQVSDGKASVQGTFVIKVTEGGGGTKPPVWLEDPVRLEARAGSPFAVTISGKAKEFSGLPLRFFKTGGPAWLTVSQAGAASGAPGIEHVGVNTFTVSAESDNGAATGTLVVTVREGAGGEQLDVVQIDTPVAGARVEATWVLDNSMASRMAVKAVLKHLPAYFDALKSAGLTSYHTVQSANVKKWDGFPVKGSSGRYEFSGSTNPVADFTERANDTYSFSYAPSLAHQLFRFHKRLPALPELYKSENYYQPGVPIETILVTQRLDYWKATALGSPQAGYAATDFGREFINFHRQNEKPFRIHALVGTCDPADPCDEDFGAPPAPKTAHQQFTASSGGSYWEITNEEAVGSALAELAKQMAVRAHINAKRVLPLSKTPSSAGSIRVTLAGTALSSSQWAYDRARNSVVLNWAVIEQSTLKAGDKIEISYTGQ